VLPWNIISQVITITIPIIGHHLPDPAFSTSYAPSSHDVRVVNYVVPINPRVNGLVTEVPIEPNRPIKKGEILFKMDPVPYEIEVTELRGPDRPAQGAADTAEAGVRSMEEQLKAATGKKEATSANSKLARLRVGAVQGTRRDRRRQPFRLRTGPGGCRQPRKAELASDCSPARRRFGEKLGPRHPRANRMKSPM
jgi:multidrug resistance efflux pump